MEQWEDKLLATCRPTTTETEEAKAEMAAVQVALAAAEREKKERKEVKQILIHGEQLFAEKCTAIPSGRSEPDAVGSGLAGAKREDMDTKFEAVNCLAPESTAISAITSDDVTNGIMPIPSQTADSSHPGAYAVQTTRFDGIRRTAEAAHAGADEEEARGNHAEDPGLAEAKPVNEDETYGETLQQARQVNIRTRQQPRENVLRKPVSILCYLLSCIILVVVVVSITTGSNNPKTKNEEASSAVLTSVPCNTVTALPTPSPTDVLYSVREELPSATQKQLQVFGTPQWLAWDWLFNHPNITSFPDWKKLQLFSLVTFFYSFEGGNWNPLVQERWTDYTVDECFWFSSGFGFIVVGQYYELAPQMQDPPCDGQGKFTNLALSGLELSGLNPSIPHEITLLTSLKSLLLDGNDLQGNLLSIIPFESLRKLQKFSYISFVANELTGPIPSEIGLLSNSLKRIGLSTFFTQGLTGTLPDSLFLMSNLEQLFLLGNAISGTIPTEVGLLTKLTGLNFAKNLFSGQLPTEVGLLSSLSALSIQSTSVSGIVPTEIGLLEPMIYLDLSFTNLSGTIPTHLGKLSFLENLNMDAVPMLTGSIPTELSRLTDLWVFNLTGSQLSGTIPGTFCHLKNESCVGGAYREQCILDFDCGVNLCGCDCPCQRVLYQIRVMDELPVFKYNIDHEEQQIRCLATNNITA